MVDLRGRYWPGRALLPSVHQPPSRPPPVGGRKHCSPCCSAASSTPHPIPSLPTGREKGRSEEHTSELQSHLNLVCRLLLEKKKKQITTKKRRTTRPFFINEVAQQLRTY